MISCIVVCPDSSSASSQPEARLSTDKVRAPSTRVCPVAEPVAHARHRQIVASTARLKSSGAAVGASTMLDLAALAPPVLHATLARSLYANRLFNVTITNVPGPQFPLYAHGAQLREIHPVVPLAADHGVGIAIFSYNGLVTFGVIADRDSTPDLDVLASGIEEGVAELLELVPTARDAEPVGPGTMTEDYPPSWARL